MNNSKCMNIHLVTVTQAPRLVTAATNSCPVLVTADTAATNSCPVLVTVKRTPFLLPGPHLETECLTNYMPPAVADLQHPVTSLQLVARVQHQVTSLQLVTVYQETNSMAPAVSDLHHATVQYPWTPKPNDKLQWTLLSIQMNLL